MVHVAFSLVLLHAFLAALSSLPTAQVAPSRRLSLNEADEKAILERHNSLRSKVMDPCTAADMETLQWDPALALSAQAYADRCLADHNASKGENIAYRTYQTSMFGLSFTTTDLVNFVQEWYSESANADWSSSSLGVKSKVYEIPQTGCSLYDPDTGACSIRHYTQLAWARTNKVGCGASACQSGLTLRGFKYAAGIVFVCRYSPVGNTMDALRPSLGILRPWTCGSCCEGCATGNNCTIGLCPIGVSPTDPNTCNPTTTTTNTTTSTTSTTTTITTLTTTSSTSTTFTTTTSNTTTSTSTTYCRCETTTTTTTTSPTIGPCTPATCPDMWSAKSGRTLSLASSPLPANIEQHKAAIVSKHNELRAAVSSPCTATDMETLTWDSTLALAAQTYANKCITKSDAARGSVGENFVVARSGSFDAPDFVKLIQDWYDEVGDVQWTKSSAGPSSKLYNNPKKACKRYDASTGACFIGHYTQIVWARSNKIGCGAAVCSEAPVATGGNATSNETTTTTTTTPLDMNETLIFVCRYSPNGNTAARLGQAQAGMLPPFRVGLHCADCASTCSVPGLCDAGTTPTRCADTVTPTSPIWNSFTSCNALIARYPNWCTEYEHSYRKCQLTCKKCTVPSGIGPQFCDTSTTTTTTSFTTTTSTTTPPTTTTVSLTTVTTTKGNGCVWVCYRSFPTTIIPTTIPITTSTTTATTTTILISQSKKTVITGSLVLTVPNATAFMADDLAKGAVAHGIADALGVAKDYVTVSVRSWSGKNRRLGDAVKDKHRRLGDAVTVDYTTTIPASASSALKVAVAKKALAVTVAELGRVIQGRVREVKGVEYAVALNSKTVPLVKNVSSPASPSTTSFSAPLVRNSRMATAFVLFAWMCLNRPGDMLL